jgi:hypothetical protein
MPPGATARPGDDAAASVHVFLQKIEKPSFLKFM